MPVIPTTITGQNTHYRAFHARKAEQYGRLVDQLDETAQAMTGDVASIVQRYWRQDETWARINGLGVALASHIAARLDAGVLYEGRYITCEKDTESVVMRVRVSDSFSSPSRIYVEVRNEQSASGEFCGVGYVDGAENNHQALACWLGFVLGGGLGHWAQDAADMESEADSLWDELVEIANKQFLDQDDERK